MPEFINVTYQQVTKYWDDWLIWRSVGKRNSIGQFEPAITYLEAIQSIPHEEMTVFTELDNIYAKMESQYLKQTTGKKSNG